MDLETHSETICETAIIYEIASNSFIVDFSVNLKVNKSRINSATHK